MCSNYGLRLLGKCPTALPSDMAGSAGIECPGFLCPVFLCPGFLFLGFYVLWFLCPADHTDILGRSWQVHQSRGVDPGA